jgi:hypothetical protein
VKRSAAALAGATGAISAVTVANRLGAFDVRTLAATPQSVADGRVWLLLTSTLLADKPAVASIAGFLVVGLAALALCGGRAVWVSALIGHIGSALLVYLGIALTHRVVTDLDYGTSAIIAAWIGAIAAVAWSHGRRRGAVALVVASAFVGWLCKNQLTILDAEHAFALAAGAAVAAPGQTAGALTHYLGRSATMHGLPTRRGATDGSR